MNLTCFARSMNIDIYQLWMRRQNIVNVLLTLRRDAVATGATHGLRGSHNTGGVLELCWCQAVMCTQHWVCGQKKSRCILALEISQRALAVLKVWLMVFVPAGISQNSSLLKSHYCSTDKADVVVVVVFLDRGYSWWTCDIIKLDNFNKKIKKIHLNYWYA